MRARHANLYFSHAAVGRASHRGIYRLQGVVMQILRGGVYFDLPRGCCGESTLSAIVGTTKNRLFLSEPGLFSILTVILIDKPLI